MRVIIVIAPHPILRLGLIQLLTEAFIETVIQVGDYSPLGQKEKQYQKTKPCDLILLTLASQDPSCAYLDRVTQVYSPRSILLFDETGTHNTPTLYCDQPLIRGLVSKESSAELIKASVGLVLAGGTCFPNYICTTALPTDQTINEADLLGLTKRQHEILVLLAMGYSLKIIARQLNIALATTKSHTETLYQRLNVHNRNAAVHVALSQGATLCWADGHTKGKGE